MSRAVTRGSGYDTVTAMCILIAQSPEINSVCSGTLRLEA
jgi:hypothetical protein